MSFNYEYKHHVRAGFIGCGNHAFQSILPSLQYAPVGVGGGLRSH